MKIAVLYFSGTDVTALVARSVYNRLNRKGCTVDLIDITPQQTRDRWDDSGYDALILGCPVYSDFAPAPVNDWLKTLEGRNRKCVIFCTYGGRSSGYFHYHTWQILQERGFSLLMSAEFLGRHTFNVAGWAALPERPDGDDLFIAGELADKALELFSQKEGEALFLQKPLGYKEKLAALEGMKPSAQPAPNQPFRTGDCSLCGRCEEECPTGAFDKVKGTADPETCLKCQRCLFHCPDEVLVLHESMYRSYDKFLNDWNLTEEIMEKKRSKLILHAWDTVQ
ncbi:MAG: 4Fe-4S binding protein [Spirochaetales bacterium]|nr:4Fe-4S binding protein [Spirochaetales bacterium]